MIKALKAIVPTYFSNPAVVAALPFATIAEAKSAMSRVAAFGIIGTKNRPLLGTYPTQGENDRVEKALQKWIDDGNLESEFTDSAKIWSHAIPEGFLDVITDDVIRIVATWVALKNGKAGVLAGWILAVKGYAVSFRQAIGAYVGDSESKLSLRDIVKACR
jgi:hypothetical protein